MICLGVEFTLGVHNCFCGGGEYAYFVLWAEQNLSVVFSWDYIIVLFLPICIMSVGSAIFFHVWGWYKKVHVWGRQVIDIFVECWNVRKQTFVKFCGNISWSNIQMVAFSILKYIRSVGYHTSFKATVPHIIMKRDVGER